MNIFVQAFGHTLMREVPEGSSETIHSVEQGELLLNGKLALSQKVALKSFDE